MKLIEHLVFKCRAPVQVTAMLAQLEQVLLL